MRLCQRLSSSPLLEITYLPTRPVYPERALRWVTQNDTTGGSPLISPHASSRAKQKTTRAAFRKCSISGINGVSEVLV
jgi:hypothetical protein